MTPDEQPLSVQLTVDGEETPSIEDTLTLPGASDDTPSPWPEHIWQRKNVRATESYRLVTVIDGQRYERQDVASCINENREADPEFPAHHEVTDISIQSTEVSVLTEDCPADT